ncbi:MAG: hypothetical protein CSB49_05250 [Proteobacteria bacterium]|nr:MAG: hypothetical protein CSB49_05250 [Pseudomonadota bacterium]
MSFVGKFFLLVLVLGFAELWLLVNVAGGIGFVATLGLCILTGMVGGALVRHQGLRTLQQIQQAVGRGEVPAVQIVSGLVLLIVGALLIVPGFITDILGFVMLVPGLRGLAAGRVAKSLEGRVQPSFGGFGASPFGGASGPFDGDQRGRGARGPVVIDVDADERPKRDAEADKKADKEPIAPVQRISARNADR